MKNNIKDFISYKELYSLSKKRSSHSIKFVTNITDDWIVYVLEYKTKTGEILHDSMIIKTDVDDWLSHLKHVGYELKI